MQRSSLLFPRILFGKVRKLETNKIDVTHTAWRRSGKLLIAGVRDIESVLAEIDPKTEGSRELWKSETLYPHIGRYPWAGSAARGGYYEIQGA